MHYETSFHARHNNSSEPEHHLFLHKPFVFRYSIDVDHQAVDNVAGIFIAVSSVWMLLNVCRALNSGWPLQIQADATYGICAEAVGLLGFGVNSLGAHIHLVGMAIIPESESTKLYTETWTAIREALHSLLTNFVFCPIHGCQCCEAVRAAKEHDYTREMLDSEEFSRDKFIPVAHAGSDNSSAFRLFSRNELNLKADQCFSHLTGK